MTTPIFVGLLALRFALFFTPLPEILRKDAQLSSPLTSYTRLREGVYLFENGIDPYAGGVFRQSPLLLAIFSTVLPLWPIVSALVWTLCDGLSAWCLVKIWRLRRLPLDVTRENVITIVYLMNPYILLPTLALSTSSLDNTLHIVSLYFASTGRDSLALLTLSALTCTSLPSILLLPPVIILIMNGPASGLVSPRASKIDRSRSLFLAAEFFTYLTAFILISSLMASGWSWVPRTWGAVVMLPDLTPNPGLWWYFFTEMFDHFRPFFLLAFSVHLIIYVAPVTIKLSHDPLFAAFILQGIIATFKSYPTLSDPGLFTSMIAIFPEIIPYLRHPLPTVLLHLHAALLLPLFHHLWIGQGTGNANFFYASTLVFGLGNGGAVIDALYGGLRAGYGATKEGYAIVQT